MTLDITDRASSATDLVDRAWEALRAVPDPEIPVVSVVELGIVRDVASLGDELRVRITPTYSGCPATATIEADIRAVLRDIGIEHPLIETRLAPPWSTDWIAPEAKAKLRAFGIAPPGASASSINVAGISPLRRSSRVPCPRCASTDTALVAQFGSTACKALYRCRRCDEPFDYFKPF